MANEVRVNNNVLSWGSVSIKADGISQSWITSVDYSDKRERAFVYGTGRHQSPRGRTRGKYTPEEGKLKGPKKDVRDFLKTLAQKSNNGANFADVEFQLVIQFVEGTDTTTDELVRCVVTGVNGSFAEGSEAMEQEVTFSMFGVIRDGMTMWDSTPGV